MRSLRSGHQNKIIAYELGISESTVKVHLRNIMKKLNASNRTQVALVGPVLFDRSGARAYAAVGLRDEFDPGLSERARGARARQSRSGYSPARLAVVSPFASFRDAAEWAAPDRRESPCAARRRPLPLSDVSIKGRRAQY